MKPLIYHQQRNPCMVFSLFLAIFFSGPLTAFTEKPSPPTPSSQEPVGPSTESVPPPGAGEVQERGLPRMMPGRMAPGGKILAPGGTFSALTKAECTGLGCKTVTDNTCPDVGALKERCVCKGGGKGLCIDAVK